MKLDNCYPEEWRIIEEFPIYYVSNKGRVKNLDGEILTGGKDKDGYRQVTLCFNHKQYNRRICRLVAIAFIENPLNLPIVNHRDEVKNNDYIDNLEWCTIAYNNSYGSRLSKTRKKVRCIETGIIYDGLHVAEKQTGIRHQNICQCCKNPNRTAGGYHWEYYNNKEENDENDAKTSN